MQAPTNYDRMLAWQATICRPVHAACPLAERSAYARTFVSLCRIPSQWIRHWQVAWSDSSKMRLIWSPQWAPCTWAVVHSESLTTPLFCMPGMFNGKLWVEKSQEIPISWEMGGESLNLGSSWVTGISHGIGNYYATGNSRILKAITDVLPGSF